MIITSLNDVELSKPKERGETYWPLKGSVYPPSNYVASKNAKRAPPQKLELEFVYPFLFSERVNVYLNYKVMGIEDMTVAITCTTTNKDISCFTPLQ
jgi:hypothetical protein